MKIAFYDSGLGGLLMTELVQKKYPNYNYVYVGDTAHLPYGPKDPIEILGYMEPYLLWLINSQLCDYVCVACNTASVKSLPLFIRKYPQYKKRFIDIVSPTQIYLENINQLTLVLATTGTVASGLYNGNSFTTTIAMPGLVDLIEGGHIDTAIMMIDDVLSYYPNTKNIVLACTHYVRLKKNLTKKYSDIEFISQDNFIINQIAEKNTINNSITKVTRDYFVTGDHEKYSQKYGYDFKHLNIFNPLG